MGCLHGQLLSFGPLIQSFIWATGIRPTVFAAHTTVVTILALTVLVPIPLHADCALCALLIVHCAQVPGRASGLQNSRIDRLPWSTERCYGMS